MEKADLFEKKLHDKVKDTANIYYEYEFLMEQYGFKDHLENIREAAKTANLHRFFKGKTVFLDEFESFTGVLASAQNRVDQLSGDLEKLVGTRTRQMQRKLKDISVISLDEAKQIIDEE
jgi:DNA anti-recombination protein RmuC